MQPKLPGIAKSAIANGTNSRGPQNQDLEGARVAWDFLKRHTK
ncbi:MAG: hypothetical protein ACKO13_05495 [Cytophagales bacterium]